MIFQAIQKQRPHFCAAGTTVTTIQFYKPLFFTPQEMNLKSNTYSKSIAAVRIIFKLD